jgi:hypothetical protein
MVRHSERRLDPAFLMKCSSPLGRITRDAESWPAAAAQLQQPKSFLDVIARVHLSHRWSRPAAASLRSWSSSGFLGSLGIAPPVTRLGAIDSKANKPLDLDSVFLRG